MEKVQEHVRAFGAVAEYKETTFMEDVSLKQLELRMPNGSVIYGLPANPETARGFTGNVTLDEFAFHADADRIYTALYPTITRGYSLEIISTPNGQTGKFYELAKAAGLTEFGVGSSELARTVSEPRTPNSEFRPAWSGHRVTLYEAVEQGLARQLKIPDSEFLSALRAGVDDRDWAQEYCCEFVSTAAQWISPELWQACVSSEASAEFGVGSSELAGKPEPRTPKSEPRLYAGWDIARKRDLSVIWISELVGDVTWTRGVMALRNLPTPDQLREARSLMPLLRRMTIDQSGMGLALFEQLAREFPGKVEGVQFTQAKKEAMAVRVKDRMEKRLLRIPDSDECRHSFLSLKRAVTDTGLARFDAEHDAKYGHADHFWACALAEAAAEQPTANWAECAFVTGEPVAAGLRERVL